MKRIPKLTDHRIISTFFGAAAKPYNYEVTYDEFDEYDNEGPGHYIGVEVPDDLADRWDSGIIACREAGLRASSREGYALRWRLWTGDDNAQLPAALIERLDEREARQRERNRPQVEWNESTARVRDLVQGLAQTGYGPGVYKCREAPSGWAIYWHVYCHKTDDTVTPEVEHLGEPLVVVRDHYVPSFCRSVGDRPVRGMLWRTRYGFLYLDPRIHSKTHYASAEKVKEWRLTYARLNGVDSELAERLVDSPYIGDDQQQMCQAVLDA